MIWLVLALAGALLVAIIAIYVLGTRRAVKAAGTPTPEAAKITAKTIIEARALVDQGEKEKTEVMHADREGLRSKLADLVRGKR